MKRFFNLTFRPFFVLTGFGTATIGLYAFWPQWAVAKLGKLQFLQDYTIIVQHCLRLWIQDARFPKSLIWRAPLTPDQPAPATTRT